MADGMENWRSEDYFEGRRENPFRFVRDDESPKEEGAPVDDR